MSDVVNASSIQISPAIVADHDVGVGIEGEKRSASASTRSRMLRRISSRLSGVTSSLKGSLARSPRSSAISRTPEEAAERDAAVALVRRDAVGFALRDS